jgi:ATP-grasp domain, R2K clade family 3
MWVLQQNMRNQARLARIKDILGELQLSWCEVPLVPFTTEIPPLPFDPRSEPVICYGPSFVPRVASHTSWRPGIYFDQAAFQWSTMRRQWGEWMLSADGESMPLAAAIAVLDATEARRFVRPDADSKQFDGGVYDANELRVVTTRVAAQEPVIVARSRQLIAEWRCFVVDGSVVASSEYRRGGRPSLFADAPPMAVEFAEFAAAQWVPAPVTCIDIGLCGERFGVIEANCFSASGFYAADTVATLAAVTAFAYRAS